MMTTPDPSAIAVSVTTAAQDAVGAANAMAEASASDRAGWLRSVADALDARRDELAVVAHDETALGLARLTGEVGRTTGQLRMFATVIEEGGYLEATLDLAESGGATSPPDLRRMLIPLGPVAVFAASNFPFAFSVAGGDSASALAAGCPVVVKAHPGHPETSRETAAIVIDSLRRAGAPDGIFSLVEGFEAGKELVLDPRIKAVGFTGSLAGGRALLDLASGREDPIPFYGELGSLNPVVLSQGAVAERAEELAAGLAESFTLGVGQFCTKPGVVFVPAGSGFEQTVAAAVPTAAGEAVMLNDNIAERFAAGLNSMVAVEDVDVVAGDPASSVANRTASPVVLATSVETLLGATEQLLEECFGPMTLLVRYRDQAELLQALDAFPGTLAATIHAEPDEQADFLPVVRALTKIAGRIVCGGWPTGVAVSWSQHHGGPWPSTTSPLHTSVGGTAIRRFLRPVVFQNVPEAWLPGPLRADHLSQIPHRVNGTMEVPTS